VIGPCVPHQSRSRLTLKRGELASTATAAAPASPGEQQET
jgi:hypothetical protein